VGQIGREGSVDRQTSSSVTNANMRLMSSDAVNSRATIAMTPTVPRYRVVRFKCHAKGENNQVRVCTNTTCRKQGSAQIVRHLKELVDPAQVSVETSGCLANCGSGPNVAFLPSGLVVKHVTTAAHVCSLVERQCVGGQSASLVLKALEVPRVVCHTHCHTQPTYCLRTQLCGLSTCSTSIPIIFKVS